MRYIPISAARELSRRFDVFDDDEAAYDNDLLEAGLFPPLAVCGDELVWGFRIVRGAAKIGLEQLPALEVQRRGRLLCALKLEGRTGKYSREEQLAIYKLALELGAGEEPQLLSLAVSGDGGFFSRTKRYAALPDHLLTGVQRGRLDIGTAEKLGGLPESVCKLVVSDSNLSFSQVRTFLLHLEEIMRRDGLQYKELYGLAGRLLSTGDPAGEIGKIRNPELSRLTRAFEGIQERYTRHTGIKLQAPRNFEGDEYMVSFPFRSKDDFLKKLRSLEKLKEGCEELEELL
jgi:hypothetical protein